MDFLLNWKFSYISDKWNMFLSYRGEHGTYIVFLLSIYYTQWDIMDTVLCHILFIILWLRKIYSLTQSVPVSLLWCYNNSLWYNCDWKCEGICVYIKWMSGYIYRYIECISEYIYIYTVNQWMYLFREALKNSVFFQNMAKYPQPPILSLIWNK